MSKTAYNISLIVYVGGYDFDRLRIMMSERNKGYVIFLT